MTGCWFLVIYFNGLVVDLLWAGHLKGIDLKRFLCEAQICYTIPREPNACFPFSSSELMDILLPTGTVANHLHRIVSVHRVWGRPNSKINDSIGTWRLSSQVVGLYSYCPHGAGITLSWQHT